MTGMKKHHRRALDLLRERDEAEKENEEKILKEERARLGEIVQFWAEQREREEELQANLDYLEHQKIHLRRISKAYVNHDAEYGAKLFSPRLLGMWAECTNYLEPATREAIYGIHGYLNTGFPVEGPVPLFGAWPDARPMSTQEKQAIWDTREQLRERLAQIDQMSKLRSEPYEFENEQTMGGCLKAVEALLAGPWAEPLPKAEAEKSGEWIFPFFGLGQKWDSDTQAWRKVRPIASEKLRNRICSPASEHMSLPGTDVVIDFAMYAANPQLKESLMQSKRDITASIQANRKKKNGQKMAWTDVTTLPQPLKQFKGHSFVPVFGKLDLYQAYLQLGVNTPRRNVFQYYVPELGEYKFGFSNALSFGNVHSVFGFVASISELLDKVLNEILMMPALVYIDDIAFAATPGLIDLYMETIRKMLAIAGIAVAPEKCETAKMGEEIEILGIVFVCYPDRIEVYLSTKKINSITKKMSEAAHLLTKLQLQIEEEAKPPDPAAEKQEGRPKMDVWDVFHALEEVSGLFIRATFWRNVLFRDAFRDSSAVMHCDNAGAACGLVKEQLRQQQTRSKKTGNHYSGAMDKYTAEKIDLTKEDPRRPRAQNVVPRCISQQWPMSSDQTLYVWPEECVHLSTDGGLQGRNSKWRVWMYYVCHNIPDAFFLPSAIDTTEKCRQLREQRPNILWAQLQLFAHWLMEKEIQKAKIYISLVSQRLRSLCALERGNPQSNHLQTLTLKNVEAYAENFKPARAVPPSIDFVRRLSFKQQRIFSIWISTGLRKDSMASLRPDMVNLVMPEGKFMEAAATSVKSIPLPGELFKVYFPAALCAPPYSAEDLFPVSPYELDRIAHAVKTTSHGIRRGLAIYLRKRCADVGAIPGSKEFAIFKQRVCDAFGWTRNSVMWEEIYTEDAALYVSCRLLIHKDIDTWFTSDLY
eukprot:g5839.t1